MSADFLRQGHATVAAITEQAPAPTKQPAKQPAAPVDPDDVPLPMPQPAVEETPSITPKSLKMLASFAGKLCAAASGIEAGSMDEDRAIARLLQDGTIGVKVPMGNQAKVSLDTLKEVGGDLSKGLFGFMKTVGLGHFTKATDLRVQSGASCSNKALHDSAFVIAFTLKP
jgi:hypothetical protein